MSLILRLLGSAFVVYWMVTAFGLFECPYVGIIGSNRIVRLTCYSEPSLASEIIVLPGPVTGLGILGLGGLLLYWWWVRPFRMARREEAVVDAIGSAMDASMKTYDDLKDRDPQIQATIDSIKSVSDADSFTAALASAALMDSRIGAGPFRLDWVMAARKTLVQLVTSQSGISEDEAELQVAEVEDTLRGELGKTPVVWAMSASPDEAVALFAHLVERLAPGTRAEVTADPKPMQRGAKESGEAGSVTETDPDDSTLDQIERLAILYERGLISEEEYARLKARAIGN